MKLHESPDLFKQAITITAQQMNIPPEYVEKDYWVTFALKRIFQSPINEEVVFKGGTALSKCYGLIERFSEDIDLVILRKSGESDNKMKQKLKVPAESIRPELPEIEVPLVTNKLGQIRKTAHAFKKLFSGDYGHATNYLLLESTWFGSYEPFVIREVCTLLESPKYGVQLKDTLEAFGMGPFEVKVQYPTRTLCEKIMSLVRFSFSSTPIEDLQKKIRHIYDLCKLLEVKELLDFLYSDDFECMILNVASDDRKGYRNNQEWLSHHPKRAVIFDQTKDVWKKLEETYQKKFALLVYGSLPSQFEVFETLEKIRNRLEPLEWNISKD